MLLIVYSFSLSLFSFSLFGIWLLVPFLFVFFSLVFVTRKKTVHLLSHHGYALFLFKTMSNSLWTNRRTNAVIWFRFEKNRFVAFFFVCGTQCWSTDANDFIWLFWWLFKNSLHSYTYTHKFIEQCQQLGEQKKLNLLFILNSKREKVAFSSRQKFSGIYASQRGILATTNFTKTKAKRYAYFSIYYISGILGENSYTSILDDVKHSTEWCTFSNSAQRRAFQKTVRCCVWFTIATQLFLVPISNQTDGNIQLDTAAKRWCAQNILLVRKAEATWRTRCNRKICSIRHWDKTHRNFDVRMKCRCIRQLQLFWNNVAPSVDNFERMRCCAGIVYIGTKKRGGANCVNEIVNEYPMF